MTALARSDTARSALARNGVHERQAIRADATREQATRIATELLPYLLGPIAIADNPLSAPPKTSLNATFLRYLLGWMMHNSLGARRGKIHECFGSYDRSFTRDANRRIEDARMDDDWDEVLGALSEWVQEGERLRALLATPAMVAPLKPQAWYESPLAMMFRRAGAVMNAGLRLPLPSGRNAMADGAGIAR